MTHDRPKRLRKPAVNFTPDGNFRGKRYNPSNELYEILKGRIIQLPNYIPGFMRVAEFADSAFDDVDQYTIKVDTDEKLQAVKRLLKETQSYSVAVKVAPKSTGRNPYYTMISISSYDSRGLRNPRKIRANPWWPFGKKEKTLVPVDTQPLPDCASQSPYKVGNYTYKGGERVLTKEGYGTVTKLVENRHGHFLLVKPEPNQQGAVKWIGGEYNPNSVRLQPNR